MVDLTGADTRWPRTYTAYLKKVDEATIAGQRKTTADGTKVETEVLLAQPVIPAPPPDPPPPDPEDPPPDPEPPPPIPPPPGETQTFDYEYKAGDTWLTVWNAVIKKSLTSPVVKLAISRDVGSIVRETAGGGLIRVLGTMTTRKARTQAVGNRPLSGTAPSGPLSIEYMQVRPWSAISNNSLVFIDNCDGLTLIETDILGDMLPTGRYLGNGAKTGQYTWATRFAMYGGVVAYVGNSNSTHGFYFSWNMQSCILRRVQVFNINGAHDYKLYPRNLSMSECIGWGWGNAPGLAPAGKMPSYSTTLLDMGTYGRGLIEGCTFNHYRRSGSEYCIDMRTRHGSGTAGEPDKRMNPLYGAATFVWIPSEASPTQSPAGLDVVPAGTGAEFSQGWWDGAEDLDKYFVNCDVNMTGAEAGWASSRTVGLSMAGTVPSVAGWVPYEQEIPRSDHWRERVNYHLADMHFTGYDSDGGGGDTHIRTGTQYQRMDPTQVFTTGVRPPGLASWDTFISSDETNGAQASARGIDWFMRDLQRADAIKGTNLFGAYDKYKTGRQRVDIYKPTYDVPLSDVVAALAK